MLEVAYSKPRTELVLRDSRKPGKFETDSGFQKNDAFLTPFFQALFQTRVFIGSTSQTSHTTSNHTAKPYQTKPIKKPIKATNHKPNNSYHPKSHYKPPPNQVNQNISQSTRSHTKQLIPLKVTLQNIIKPSQPEH